MKLNQKKQARTSLIAGTRRAWNAPFKCCAHSQGWRGQPRLIMSQCRRRQYHNVVSMVEYRAYLTNKEHLNKIVEYNDRKTCILSKTFPPLFEGFLGSFPGQENSPWYTLYTVAIYSIRQVTCHRPPKSATCHRSQRPLPNLQSKSSQCRNSLVLSSKCLLNLLSLLNANNDSYITARCVPSRNCQT